MSRLQRPLVGLSSARASIQPWSTQLLPMRWPATGSNGNRRHASGMPSRRDQELMVPAMSRDEHHAAMHRAAFLIPGTFVALPFSRAPKQPRAFFNYQYERFYTKAWDVITLLGLKISSMPSWLSRPLMKTGRRQIVPTAKALHRLMGDSMAAGDTETLREVCVPSLHTTLTGAIQKRKRNERIIWDVKYKGSPRILSHKMISLPPLQVGPVIQQAVVAIHTEQSLEKYDLRTDKKISSSKPKEMVEYVVLTRHIDQKTWKPHPWRIFGNTKESTLEDWLLDKRAFEVQQEEAVKKGM